LGVELAYYQAWAKRNGGLLEFGNIPNGRIYLDDMMPSSPVGLGLFLFFLFLLFRCPCEYGRKYGALSVMLVGYVWAVSFFSVFFMSDAQVSFSFYLGGWYGKLAHCFI
jgi:hypothetical protein